MKKIITLGASTSKNSINKILAEYTGGFLENVELLKLDLNDFDMPFFSVDVESEFGFSEATKKLNDLVENADGFIISFAEHNGAYSAAFKNTFDWLSRIESNVWRNKPMLLLATSPGARGGKTVLEIAAGRFPYHGGEIVGDFSLPSFYDNFKEGEISNVELKSDLLKLVANFQKAL